MVENYYRILCWSKSKMKRQNWPTSSLSGGSYGSFKQRWLQRDEVTIYSWLPKGPRHSLSCSCCLHKRSSEKKSAFRVSLHHARSPAEPSLSTYANTCTDTQRIVPASPPSAQTTSLARSQRCSWAQHDTSWCPPSCQGAPTRFCRGRKKERTNPGWRDGVAMVTSKSAFCLSILMFSYAWILFKMPHILISLCACYNGIGAMQCRKWFFIPSKGFARIVAVWIQLIQVYVLVGLTHFQFLLKNWNGLGSVALIMLKKVFKILFVLHS